MHLPDIARHFKPTELLGASASAAERQQRERRILQALRLTFQDQFAEGSIDKIAQTLDYSAFEVHEVLSLNTIAGVSVADDSISVLTYLELPLAVVVEAVLSHPDAFIVNPQLALTVATELNRLIFQQRIHSLSDQAHKNVKSEAAFFLDERQTMFALRELCLSQNLAAVAARHRCFYVDAGHQVHPVLGVGELTSSPQAGYIVPLTLATGYVDANPLELMFELLPGQGDLATALQAYRQDTQWRVLSMDKLALSARMEYREAGQVARRNLLVGFRNLQEYESFVQALGANPTMLRKGSLDSFGFNSVTLLDHRKPSPRIFDRILSPVVPARRR